MRIARCSLICRASKKNEIQLKLKAGYLAVSAARGRARKDAVSVVSSTAAHVSATSMRRCETRGCGGEIRGRHPQTDHPQGGCEGGGEQQPHCHRVNPLCGMFLKKPVAGSRRQGAGHRLCFSQKTAWTSTIYNMVPPTMDSRLFRFQMWSTATAAPARKAGAQLPAAWKFTERKQ